MYQSIEILKIDLLTVDYAILKSSSHALKNETKIIKVIEINKSFVDL